MLNLNNVRNHTEVGTGYTKDAMLNLCADEIERLRAENEALKRDAERYRWLITNGAANSKSGGSATVSKDQLKALFSFRYWCDPIEVAQAIDNAIKGEKHE